MDIKDPDQNASKSIRPSDTPRKEGDAAPIDASTVPEVPPVPDDSSRSSQRTGDTTPPWKKSIEIAAVLTGMGLLVVNIFQMRSSKKAADAASSAAKTARDALHISERAYLVLSSPHADVAALTATFTLTNSGRLPSGTVDATIHEVTSIMGVGGGPLDAQNVIEKHWKHTQLPMMFNGHEFNFLVPFPAAELSKLMAAQQTVIIAGKITYNDGFQDEPIQEWKFCSQARYNARANNLFWVPCNAELALPRIEQLDGYPNNEQLD